MAGLRSILKLLGCCVLAGVLLAGVLFPVAGGLGLASNRASDTVASVSDELAEGRVPQLSTMLDAAGNPIAYFWEQRRTPVTSDQISEAMKLAIISVEDRRFYENSGVDWRGTARAAVTNATAGQTEQGASTLTQQYVKNYLLLVVAQNDAERRQATETTPARKLREIRIALALNEQLTKDEILTRYLNIVPFGNGAYGIEQAARTYFGVAAVDLTVPQSAMLAGMVQSSSALNPYTNTDGVTDRRNVVLDTMAETGALSMGDADAVKALPLGVLPEPQSPGNGCIGAGDRGFFCDYARDYLAGAGISEEDLLRGGYTIQTTLDPAVQDSTKAAVNQDTPADLPRIANVMNIVQPGQDAHRVLAMASSRAYGLDADAKETVQEQPYSLQSNGAGSTFKVFTVAAAMEQGLGINATLENPQRYEARGIGTSDGANGCPENLYCVRNFSENYEASYSVTDALAKSPNTAFVKLEEAVGVPPVIDMAVRLGLRSYRDPDLGPGDGQTLEELWSSQGAFTLGPNAVNPLEMANVGATLASSGTWCPPTPIEGVTDSTGAAVELDTQPCEQVVEPGLANTLMNAMGQDHITGTAAGAANAFEWTLPMAGKTGTTSAFGSAAFLGFTNTLAGANLVFDDTSGDNQSIRWNGTEPSSCSGEDCGNITGGTVPARTWYGAVTPIVGNFGEVLMPPLDPRYVNGTDGGSVPDVTGRGSAEATTALESLGFRVAQQTVDSSSPQGTVVRQSIVGASIPGLSVTIYLSNGESTSEQRTQAPQRRASQRQTTTEQAPRQRQSSPQEDDDQAPDQAPAATGEPAAPQPQPQAPEPAPAEPTQEQAPAPTQEPAPAEPSAAVPPPAVTGLPTAPPPA